MSTDEAGKVLKPSNDNPFIESSQQPNVVDMRGKDALLNSLKITLKHLA